MDDLANLACLPSPKAPPRWLRFIQTLASLKSEQLIRLVAKRALRQVPGRTLRTVSATPVPGPSWAPRTTFLDDPVAASFVPGSRSLRLLEVERDVGDPVDWTPSGTTRLWELELSYFHWLPGDVSWDAARPWIRDWLEHSPRNLRAWCWLPFGAAQRVLKWTRLIRGPWWDDLQRDPLYPALLRELYAHCVYLDLHQEKELLGNHLIKTATGLYAAGRFFAGAEALGWVRRSAAILRKEVRSQILEDGGHYERSPMYHLHVLVDLADALNLTPSSDPLAEHLLAAIEPMYRFAADCAHGDEEIPLFNDSVLGQVPARTAVLDYVERVAGLEPARRRTGFVAFPQFGLFRLGGEDEALWLDAGATGPSFLQAHAHADTGSFELSIGSWRVVCDTGVYCYWDFDQRMWDRSTPAHSTVTLSGESSSDCWDTFRVARRARVVDLSWNGQGRQTVQFVHDGFRHLPGSPRHERTVTYHDGAYTIRDRIRSDRDVVLRCDGFLYLGPEVTATRVDPASGASSESEAEAGCFELSPVAEQGPGVRVEVRFSEPTGQRCVYLEPASFSRRFRTHEPGSRIRAACLTSGRELQIEWVLTVSRATLTGFQTTSAHDPAVPEP